MPSPLCNSLPLTRSRPHCVMLHAKQSDDGIKAANQWIWINQKEEIWVGLTYSLKPFRSKRFSPAGVCAGGQRFKVWEILRENVHCCWSEEHLLRELRVALGKQPTPKPRALDPTTARSWILPPTWMSLTKILPTASRWEPGLCLTSWLNLSRWPSWTQLDYWPTEPCRVLS